MQGLALMVDQNSSVSSSKIKETKSVVQLLQWAFGAECAQLDLDEYGFSQRASMASQLRILQQGCRVDGGGRSLPHHDAELISGAVASLIHKRAVGGARLALDVAHYARFGKAPDWMPGAQPKCAPVRWMNSRYGPRAMKDVSTDWRGLSRKNKYGAQVRVDVDYCPIVWQDTPDEIAAARRRYLEWYGALIDIRDELKRLPLERYVVSDKLPRRAPWRKKNIDGSI
ncbi:hypothetical protein [Planktotalea sp.]|uniref:hypothetical protein n=1 Tax=Planktotalea sp. TaxID=2029877 RepID=UPI003D6ABE54